MKSSFIRTLLISFSLSIVLLIITSVASFISIHNLLESAKWVNHTNEVIHRLEETLSTLKDAETGQRGYLLTGNTEYLEPYQGAQDKALDILIATKKLVGDN